MKGSRSFVSSFFFAASAAARSFSYARSWSASDVDAVPGPATDWRDDPAASPTGISPTARYTVSAWRGATPPPWISQSRTAERSSDTRQPSRRVTTRTYIAVDLKPSPTPFITSRNGT